MDISQIDDNELLQEIGRRFDEKKASIKEMEFMTKKLLALNEKNQEVQEVKSKFLSLIKNEFNNPMSSLLNIVNMMLKKTDDPKTLELSKMMSMELLKLDFSLKNIFSASEIEAGEIANDYSVVDIKEIFDEAIGSFGYLIEEKSLDVNFSNNCSEKIISDSQKLYIILLNLISNACEYSFDNSTVNVILGCNEKEFKIIVEDTGDIISHDHAKEIYKRFAHFESGLTRRSAGLGLGLSVTRGMVEALEGTLDNITKGDRTIFVASFPKINEEQVELSQGIGSNEFIFSDDEGMVEF